MTRAEAFNYLGLESNCAEEDYIEAIENQIFTLRNYFLTEPVQSLLYNSRILKLQQLAEASLALEMPPSNPEKLEINTLDKIQNLEDLFRFKELILAKYRSFMAAKLHLNNTIFAAEAMIELEKGYEDRFLDLNYDIPVWDEMVKSNERIESAKAIMELKKNPVSDEFLIALRKEKRRVLDTVSRR